MASRSRQASRDPFFPRNSAPVWMSTSTGLNEAPGDSKRLFQKGGQAPRKLGASPLFEAVSKCGERAQHETVARADSPPGGCPGRARLIVRARPGSEGRGSASQGRGQGAGRISKEDDESS